MTAVEERENSNGLNEKGKRHGRSNQVAISTATKWLLASQVGKHKLGNTNMKFSYCDFGRWTR